MKEFYSENIVKNRYGFKEKGILFLLSVCLVITAILLFVTPAAILLMLCMIGIIFLVIRSMDVEYEYFFLNGDLDIDKIIHKEKRKHLINVQAKQLEIMAPVQAECMKPYEKLPKYDYSGNAKESEKYGMVVLKESERYMVIIKKDDVIIDGMKCFAPRKVKK